MIGDLLPSRKGTRPERPSFKPYLEALENREVPTCADTSAAFDALPGNVSNLQVSVSVRDVNGINASVNAIAGNVFQLQAGAPGFVIGDRLRIDSALLTDGLQMVFLGFQNLSTIPIPQFENIVQLGATSARVGFFDLLATSFFPSTSGDCMLT